MLLTVVPHDSGSMPGDTAHQDSDMVQETDEYCRDTLCDEEVAQWVTSMLVCWGGSVRYRSAFEVSCSQAHWHQHCTASQACARCHSDCMP